MIELTHVSISKQRTAILTDINLKILDGRFYLIVAPNGSGKSTLLNAIAGLEPTQTGAIVYSKHGQPIHAREQIAKICQYIPNDMHFDDEMSGADYLNFYHKIWHSSIDLNHTCRRLKIDNYITRKISSYSLGMLKMFMLAIYLVTDTDYWLLDELGNGLDDDNQQLFYLELQQACHRGKTIMMVTHQPQQLTTMADYIFTIKNKSLLEVSAGD